MKLNRALLSSKKDKPHNTRWQRVYLWFILFLLTLLLFIPSIIQAFSFDIPGNSQEIRVGYDVTGIYLTKNQDGKYRGMNLEYLYEIAKYTNWHYTFIPYTSWSQAVKDLETGKLDLLPTMLKSPEREKSLLFSDRSMGTIYVSLIVAKDDKKLPYGDLEALKGKRIGIRRNTVDSLDFKIWAQDNKLQYVEVPFDGQGDLLAALDAGQIDAAAMSYVGKARAYRAIAEFAPQDMYFAVAHNRRDLYVALNTAMTRISLMNPAFYVNITKRYMGVGTSAQLIFSESELAYIKEASPIRVTLMRHALPFSQQEKDGSFTGALPELFARISQISGLKFEFIPVVSQEEALQAIKDKKADVLARIADNIFFAEEKGLRLTSHYVDLTVVQLHKRNKKELKIIALQEPALKELLKLDTAKAQTSEGISYVILPEFLQALEDGKVDAVYCDSATASYFLRTHRASDYEIISLGLDNYNLDLGICKSMNPHLATILDKCIRNIGCEKMVSIVAKNSTPRDRSLVSILDELPGATLFSIIVLLAALSIVLAYLSFMFWRQRGIEKRLAAEKITSEKLRLKMTATQEISAAKDDFFSLISHDMRTPLNGILGFTDLAQAASTLPLAQEYLQKIKISSNILLDLINDTLQLSKLERGKLPSTWEIVDSWDFARKMLTPVSIMAKDKNINLILNIDALEHCRIKVDRLNTQNIFLNILSNAVKFTSSGGTVTMTVTSTPVADGRLSVNTIISDTGIGMSTAFLTKAFEPFSQEQRKNTDEHQGSGLGLTIVKKQVEKMGGTVQLNSKENVGTTVKVALSYEYMGPSLGNKPEILQTAPLNFNILQGQKILVCEDNKLNTEIAVKLLEKKGMSVQTASNGKEGLDIFSTSKIGEYAAILMDIRMPVMDGYQTTLAIRQLARKDAKTIPIIALSADAYEEDIIKCKASGMDDHIAKPFNPNQLYSMLAKLLS